MHKLVQSMGALSAITLFNLFYYDKFIKPAISTWGASKEDVDRPMAGDDAGLTILSTRAITINAPKSEVWKWLIQLGADRGGFYSYTFIEKAMGYLTRDQATISPEFTTLVAGDTVRGSIDEEKCILPYNFPVTFVETGKTFVLDKWGTFLLQAVNEQQTRLIIRTQEEPCTTPSATAFQYTMVALHHIMERRMLMGIKARVQAGEGKQLSETKDMIWLSGIVFSGLLVLLPIFRGSGVAQRLLIPAAFSNAWLHTLLKFEPDPVYSVSLSIIGIAALKSTVFSKAQHSASKLATPLSSNSGVFSSTSPKFTPARALRYPAPTGMFRPHQRKIFTTPKSPLSTTLDLAATFLRRRLK